MAPVTLTLTADQHNELRHHLFPADGCEAVAVILCGQRNDSSRIRLLARKIFRIPYDACSIRLPNRVVWPTHLLPPLLEEAKRERLSVIKVHGHHKPSTFSDLDDKSDISLFPSIYTWTHDGPHGSAIVFSDGRMIGRTIDTLGQFSAISSVNVVGDDLLNWHADNVCGEVPEFGFRTAQTFGSETYNQLSRMSIAVVGCSGTGSVVVEQLARNSVGKLVLVDPDIVESRNLNRILNATMADVRQETYKVEILDRAIGKMQLGTQVETFPTSLFNPNTVEAVANCDIVFGCMDSIDGRHLLNKLATFYLLPYFDIGVKIESDGKGGIEQICGSVHYLQPGGSSLLSRHVYTLEQVRAAGLQRTNPEEYQSLLQRGYIRDALEDRPAVIQLNSLIASLAINEFLARLHPYRIDPNGNFAVHRISLSHGIYDHDIDGSPCSLLSRHVGRGDINPLLDWAELSTSKRHL